MGRLRQLLWNAGTGVALRNARALLDQRRREQWIVDSLVRTLPAAASSSATPAEPHAA